jgi:transcriptional regulator GlxA family with amidase domain
MHETPLTDREAGAAPRPVAIAILALPEVSASVVYGMFDLFMSAGRDWGLIVEGRPGPQLFRPEIVAASRATFAVLIRPDAALEDKPAPACSGALLLAETGLLDGCDATTHWACCVVMKQRYPTMRVHTQRALVNPRSRSVE